MAKQANVELTSWNRLFTRSLAILPELLGQSHEFTLEGRDIAISLPTAESLPDYDTPGGYVRGKRLSLSTWQRAQDGQLQPIDVIVHDADVMVSIPGRTSIPEEARTTSSITHEFFSEQQEKHLDRLAVDYGNLAHRAFDLWIRTLRWKADDYRIGQSELSGVETTGWRTEIREKDTPNRLWAGGNSITVYVGKPVTAEVWDEVSAALNAGESPPIFYDLLYDAMAHLERGDLQRMVVDAAVAAETCMKIIVQEGLPDGLNDQLKKYINEANVRRLIDRLFPECLDTQQEKTYMNLKSDLHKLFDDRNDIMHKGEKEGLTAEHCQRLVNSVRALLALVPYGVH